MVVLGGMGSLTGSIVAAIIMFLVNYQIKNGVWVKLLPMWLQNIFAFPMLVYAIILIIVIMFRPKGIFGTYELSLRNFFSDMKKQRQNRLAQKQESKEALSHE
jgi:branched-chain amino acid transport system permease protein